MTHGREMSLLLEDQIKKERNVLCMFVLQIRMRYRKCMK